MKCSRCDCQFSADSALVSDHRYVQGCIDALKARIKQLEDVPTPIRPPIGEVHLTSCVDGGTCHADCPTAMNSASSSQSVWTLFKLAHEWRKSNPL